MTARFRLVLLVAAVAGITGVASLTAAAPTDDGIALAMLSGCVASAAALAGGAGRPLLVAAAFAGIGGYLGGGLAQHAVLVPVAIPLAVLAGATAGTLVGIVGWRLDAVAFLLLTALFTIAGGAAVQALPALTGAETGLGPLPGLGVPLGDNRFGALSPLGNLHLAALTLVAVVAGCALLDRSRFGAAWRAVGSDRSRAQATGIHPARATVAVLAAAGAVCAMAGALSAHVAGVASPTSFAVDAAAFPLLAALAAGNRPVVAAWLAVATSLVGAVVLPDIGWQGPPSAPALALGLLAVVTAVILLRRRPAPAASVSRIDAGGAWPLARGFDGIALEVDRARAHAPGGSLILDAPALSVPAGTVRALVGVNGAGKSTLLRLVEAVRRADGVVLMPQDGGGFALCTVTETLVLAAAAGGEPDGIAAARRWIDRLGLAAVAGSRCSALADGQRRLVDLARVLLTRPRVLLCDEPLAGLDAAHRDAVVACLSAAAAAGLTVLVADHDREALRTLTSVTTELQRPASGQAVHAPQPGPA